MIELQPLTKDNVFFAGDIYLSDEDEEYTLWDDTKMVKVDILLSAVAWLKDKVLSEPKYPDRKKIISLIDEAFGGLR